MVSRNHKRHSSRNIQDILTGGVDILTESHTGWFAIGLVENYLPSEGRLDRRRLHSNFCHCPDGPSIVSPSSTRSTSRATSLRLENGLQCYSHFCTQRARICFQNCFYPPPNLHWNYVLDSKFPSVFWSTDSDVIM